MKGVDCQHQQLVSPHANQLSRASLNLNEAEIPVLFDAQHFQYGKTQIPTNSVTKPSHFEHQTVKKSYSTSLKSGSFIVVLRHN